MMRCERRTTPVAELKKTWTPQASLLVDRQLNLDSDLVRWSFARTILESAGYHLQACDSSDPNFAEVALVTLEDVGHQSSRADIHKKKMRLYPDRTLQGVHSKRYATNAMEGKVGDTGKSIEAHGATYESRSLAGSLFRVIGFGLGIAGLCVTALTLVLAPVLVVEPNQWIRDLELFWIGVGLVALVAELFVTKS